MCECKEKEMKEKVNEMEETIEEIKSLLDEIVEEAREKIKAQKEEKNEEKPWDKVKIEMFLKLNLGKLSDEEYDKDKISATLDKAVPEVIKQVIKRVVEDCKR